MRTTLTLDKDVAAVIERLRRTRRQSMKDLVNEALREGLRHIEAPRSERGPFRTATIDLGRCLVGNVDDIAEVLAVTEAEPFR